MRTLLPADLEESARQSKALLRRRNVPNAAALMRMALAYAVSDLSLKDVAAWASTLEVAEITGPRLFYRLREAEGWLEQVLGQVLAEQVVPAVGGWPIRVVDATVLNGPGQEPVQWRAYVLVDPATGGFRTVELTDNSGGEKLGRHRVNQAELILGDRAYGPARGIHAVRQAEAHVVVRLTPVNPRTCDEQRRRIHMEEKEAEVPKVGAIEFDTLIPIPPKPAKSHKTWDSAKAIAWIPARAIAARTRAGEVNWILTTLSATVLPAVAVLTPYRLRWQIELSFKRLNSLLHLDTLPSREGLTAKSWMLARLIAATLAQRLVQPPGPLSPWGATNCGQSRSTHSPWSRFRMTLWAHRGAIPGKGAWLVIRSEENLARLCNSPRKRHPISDDLNRGIQEFSQLPLFQRVWEAGGGGGRSGMALTPCGAGEPGGGIPRLARNNKL